MVPAFLLRAAAKSKLKDYQVSYLDPEQNKIYA